MYRAGILAVSCLLCLASLAVAQAFDPAARAAAVAPYLDEQTFLVLHVDVSKVKVDEARELLEKVIVDLSPSAMKQWDRNEAELQTWLDALTQSGLQEVYIVASLADVPARPPFAVAKLRPDGDAERAARVMMRGPGGRDDEPPARTFRSEQILGNLVIGHPNTLARLKEQEAAKLPDLAAAFKAAGDTHAQVVLLQSEDTRRVLREMPLPIATADDEVSGKELASVQYAAIGLSFPPKLEARVIVQARDEASAAKLRSLAISALDMAGRQEEVRKLLPKFADLANLLTPKQEGNRLSVSLTKENGGVEGVLSMLAPPLQAARAAAHRAHSTNNLRQFAIALHNYHDTYKTFPAPATTKDGKSLLSWRVQILPFLEQQALYEQFRHDEPWDSEHNQKLLEKMPPIFASPGFDLEPGMTSYLGVSGKGTIFESGRATRISDITDGTSNTILIVEARADKAVPWTKPADLEVDADRPLAGLDNARDKKGFLAAFADGSVHFIGNTVDLKTLRYLFERADGNPVQGF